MKGQMSQNAWENANMKARNSGHCYWIKNTQEVINGCAKFRGNVSQVMRSRRELFELGPVQENSKVPLHAVKACRVLVELHALLPSELEAGECSASRTGRLASEKEPQIG